MPRLMNNWKWTFALLCSETEEIIKKKKPRKFQMKSWQVFASCPLNTGIIAPYIPQAQTPPKQGCRAGAAQCDEALTSIKHVHLTTGPLPFQHPRCSLPNTEITAQGLSFLSPSSSTSQQLLQLCDANSCPGGSKLMVSTQPMFVAHVDNHGVDHGGILSDHQLLLQRCLRLSFKWNLTVSLAIKK